MMPQILQANPLAAYLEHKTEIDRAIGTTLDSGRYILGREVKAFEESFAAYIGVGHAIGVGNGTDAIEVALRALGTGPGDAVFTVSHTAVATVSAIERTGASPVVVDINLENFGMDPGSLASAIRDIIAAKTLRPKAVVPVHLYGQPCDIEAILSIARTYDLSVVEDCAQAHGATIGKRRAGSFAHAAAFSFYPTKNLGALGDGGCVVTGDAVLAEKIRALREYGWTRRYESEFPGINSRLDEVQAAILKVKLRFLDADNERRRAIARRYSGALGGTAVHAPAETAKTTHVFHLYVVRCEARDKLRQSLADAGIQTAVHYPLPVHLQDAYKNRIRCTPSGLPHTEQAFGRVLSLPLYPQMRDEEVDRVCSALKESLCIL
jgi:dTDP-4-amino-4,6-dideoxygalactose transaminase